MVFQPTQTSQSKPPEQDGRLLTPPSPTRPQMSQPPNVLPTVSEAYSFSDPTTTPNPQQHQAQQEQFLVQKPQVQQQKHQLQHLKRTRSVSISEQTNNGNFPQTTVQNDPTQITYRERLGGYLHPRDMRRLVTPFSSSNEPELMVRRHVILLNFDPLRAIVLRDRLLVLVPDGADEILMSLEKCLRGGIEELKENVFGDFGDSTVDIVDSAAYSAANAAAATLVESGVVGGDITVDIKVEGLEDTEFENIGGNDASGKKSRKKVSNSEKNDDEGSGNHDGDNVKSDANSTDTLGDEYDLDNEWEDIERMNWIDMPFELQSVDAVLSSVCKMLSEDAAHLRERIIMVMEELRGGSHSSAPGDHVQEKLRILKDGVKEMEARVQGFVRAINQVLDEEEDMALMNLSRLITNPERFIQPVSQAILNEESDEPELILEAYLQQALSEVNALELLKGNIANTEELVSLQMDTVRNRLLYINTMVSAVSLCVAAASLIGSFMGMNLTNHMENDDHAFVQVVSVTMTGTVVLLGLFVFVLSRNGIMPANPRAVLKLS